jgi:hypothetical protein
MPSIHVKNKNVQEQRNLRFDDVVMNGVFQSHHFPMELLTAILIMMVILIL